MGRIVVIKHEHDMPTITLPNVRTENDVRMNVILKDNGVRVDWNSLTDIHAALYADTQRVMAGLCAAKIDIEDRETLIVSYGAGQPQYLGPQRLVIRCKYQGRKKTYDVPAFVFVSQTADLENEELEISDPEVDVELEVREVSTSLLDEAIDACIAATEEALKAGATAASAAQHQPIIDPTTKHWLVWSAENGDYQDTGVLAKGQKGDAGNDGITPHIDEDTGHWFIGSEDTGIAAQGPKGDSGDINYPTFEIDSNMHLKVSALTEGSAERFSIQNGHLKMTL